MMLSTLIYMASCFVFIWIGIGDKKRAYRLGKDVGYNVGYAQGKLDAAKEIFCRVNGKTTDEEFLRNLGVKPL